MKVGVWVDSTIFTEDMKFYNNLFRLGVDFFVTDYPELVMEARNNRMLIESLRTNTTYLAVEHPQC